MNAFALKTLAVAAMLAVAGSTAGVTFEPNHAYHFRYELRERGGYYTYREGRLTLRFSSSGTIMGYFSPDDEVTSLPVTGARRADSRFWLDFGASPTELLYVNGTIASDGSLRGYAFEARRSRALYNFTATLEQP
jgi:hypothetical protein